MEVKSCYSANIYLEVYKITVEFCNSSEAEEILECEMSCCSKFTKYLNAVILGKNIIVLCFLLLYYVSSGEINFVSFYSSWS